MIFHVFLCIILLYIEKSLGYDRYLIIRDGISVVIPVIFIVHNKYIFANKQYITVDNRYILLYTVCCKGELFKYAYYTKSFIHGADL